MYKLVFAPQARPELESLSPSLETEWANGPGVSPKSIDWSME